MRPTLGVLAALFLALAAAPACGGNNEDVPLGDDDDDGGDIDAGPGDGADARIGGDCTASGAQCNNCMDDDADGLVDGFDPECSGPLDNNEGSFATGIPGDNIDETTQDCFFDGNSGGACQVDTCCLYPEGGCPIDDPPNDCAFDAGCISECIDLVPPGCDCFGCCTVCVDSGCYDVLLNPGVNPDCTQENVDDPVACPVCQKFEDCSADECDADPTDCVLCPGETAEDLPDSCNEVNECPGGETVCPTGTECADNEYCSSGCCVSAIG
jgi:hypothetical protein